MSLICALVQLLTEVVPVSSSGHVLLAEKIGDVALDSSACGIEMPYSLYDEWLNIPSLMVFAIFFRQELALWFFNLRSNISPKSMRIFWLAAVANFFSFCLYLFMLNLFADIVFTKNHLIFTFFASALALFSVQWQKQQGAKLNFFLACIIGLAQGVAALKGISRLGTTFVAGRWLGLAGRDSLIFSLILNVQICAIFLMKHLWQHQLDIFFQLISSPSWPCLILVTIISYFLFHLTYYCAEHDYFWLFSFYYILPLGMLVFGFL